MVKPSQPENDALRVIQTARTVDEMNQAARNGYRPLVKPVIPSAKIRSKFAVYQDPETGEISMGSDYRFNGGRVPVITFSWFYPYTFPNPFAAYLIPPDLQIGEIVILADLIEDIEGIRWNQGDVYRLASCEAEWTGDDFILLHDDSKTEMLIG